MKIIIVGAGAIGSFMGGILTRADQQVTFFDLPSVVERIKKGQIRVEGLGEEIVLKNAKAVSEIEEGERFDLCIIAVKSYSTRAAIENLPEDFSEFVLTFQNGIGNEQILAEKFGKNRVIAGSITYPVSYPDPGHVIIEKQSAGIGLSPVNPSVEIDHLTSTFKAGGLNVIEVEDFRSLKWSKLLLNITCNASCAILGMTPGEIFSDTRLVNVEREQFLEALRVMDKHKIDIVDLPGYPVNRMATAYHLTPPFLLKMLLKKEIEKGRGNKKPSLLIDMEKQTGNTEVEFLNGAVYCKAYNSALPAPYNKILSETLVDIVKGWIPWEDFKGKPEAFLGLFEKI